ncbi:MAG: hypothetical protein N2654_04160 [Deltaproteobacteria bacterium]|nr:hypothetical protein [Deltaproteobacteria bacterium]
MDKGKGLTQEFFNSLAKQICSEIAQMQAAEGRSFLLKLPEKLMVDFEKSYRVFKELERQKKTLPVGADWILDNFYIIEKNLKLFKKLYTKDFDKALPKIKRHQVLPRIFVICQELVHATNQTVNHQILKSVLSEISVSLELTLAELWALKEVLRIALLFNLATLINEARVSIEERERFEEDAKVLQVETTSLTERNIKFVNLVLQKKQLLEKHATFIMTLIREKPESSIASHLLEAYFKERNIDLQERLKEEQHFLAERQLFISETFHSFNELEILDFPALLEEVSLLHKICSRDKLYLASDFRSRNKAREKIEKLSRVLETSEFKVAQKCIDYCLKTETPLFTVLFKENLFEFLAEKFKIPLKFQLLRQLDKYRLPIYLGSATFLSGVTAFLISRATAVLTAVHYEILLIFAFTFFLAFELFVQIQNAIILRLKKPRFIPRLDIKTLSDNHKTAVVVHEIIKSKNDIVEIFGQLLARAFTNPDEHIVWFALFDLVDSSRPPTATELEELVSTITSTARELRKEYQIKIFGLLRKPVYSYTQDCYIGWERKRGKLLEFLRLCRDPSCNTTFLNVDEIVKIELEGVRFCITLDSDTFPSLGSIVELVGYGAHPLNQPIFDQSNRVKEGYSIYQPRVSVNLNSYSETLFSMLMSDSEGFDPYARELSDLYFDLFDEANFIGKGLIHVDAFLRAVESRFPEEAILSHDMIESVFARCAFVSPVEFFDNVPSNYISYTSRLNRWFRGDWQLLPMLFNRQVPPLGKWKIFDNLRRSLIPVIILIALLTGLFLSIDLAKFIMLITTGIFIFPLFLSFYQLFSLGLRDITFAQRLKGFQSDFRKISAQAIFWISMLPHQAANALHAVVATLYRLYSKKKLLEWTSFSFAERLAKEQKPYAPIFFIQFVVAAPCISFATPVLFKLIGLLFATGPFLAVYLNKPRPKAVRFLTKEQRNYFSKLAFDTFLYFDKFLRPEYNFLIPDNYQVIPDKRVAERTSPTNLGYSILSLICAYELGVIDLEKCVEKLKSILVTIDSLDKFFGHLFNWYDIKSKKPLAPRYISFADSGNLLASLIVARSFLQELGKLPLIKRNSIELYAQILKADIFSTNTHEMLKNINPSYRHLVECISRILVENPDCFSRPAIEVSSTLDSDARVCRALVEKLISEMDFEILYNKDKRLFSIGYNVDSARKDTGCYDFLCSEARLSYFVVIATKNFNPQTWFSLSRVIGRVHGHYAPLSWSGTMFEYLMPELFAKTLDGSFLSHAVETAVKVHQKYGELNNIPWGLSESAYGLVDLAGNFQYKAFGVPGLGLKRGLSEDLVVAPYASVMAVMVDPVKSYQNLVLLEKCFNARGEFGFYEAIDFSKDRLAKDQQFFPVEAFFAHHQGMSLCALTNVLAADYIKALFHKDPQIEASESLLFEKKPKVMVTVSVEDLLYSEPSPRVLKPKETTQTLKTPFTGVVKSHFVSNGDLLSLIDAGGGGFIYSPYYDVFLTRWRQQGARNLHGYFFYVKDEETGETFSTSYLPLKKKGDLYEVFFAPDKFEIKQRFGALFSYLEGTVSPSYPCDIRKLSITNLGPKTKRVSVMSYAEVCLASLRADMGHPAFQKLFISSEIIREKDLIILERRPRSHIDKRLFLGHKVVLSHVFKPSEFETSRFEFIGRGRDETNPIALERPFLANSYGVVLDPVISIKQSFIIQPGQTESIFFLTALSESKDDLLKLFDKLGDPITLHYQFELSWSQSNIELKSELYNPGSFITYQQLANFVLFDAKQKKGQISEKFSQREIWKLGISGDYPIILVKIKSEADLSLVYEVLEAYSFIRHKGLPCDLVLVNLISEGYIQKIKDQIDYWIKLKHLSKFLEKPKGVYFRNRSQLEASDLQKLEKIAALVLENNGKGLSELLDSLSEGAYSVSSTGQIKVVSGKKYSVTELKEIVTPISDSCGFDDNNNFIGVFSKENLPARPWSNVLANNTVGILTTETGAGFSWAFNSREFRLTPWTNDPVQNPCSECFFIRDINENEIFSPQLIFHNDTGDIKTTYTRNFSQYERTFKSCRTILKQTVSANSIIHELVLIPFEPISIEIYYYFEPVLGVDPSDTSKYLKIDFDPLCNAFVIRNLYSDDFGDKVVITHCNFQLKSYTNSQIEVMGQHGTISDPLFMRSFQAGKPWSFSSYGEDSERKCIAFNIELNISSEQVGSEIKIVLCHYAVSSEKLDDLLEKLKEKNSDLAQVCHNELTNSIRIYTPSKSLNILASWLLHQTMSCRILGRSGFYQSGGAFGFRDQLQDALAFIYIDPEVLKNQILLHASRQFIEGDVQHWWHPPSGKGTRTRFSDDFLWLPFAVLEYLKATGDFSILNEQVDYLKGPLLKPEEHEIYMYPEPANVKESLYEHCKKAILNGFRYGDLGLPLIGCGDWNDGFSEVGKDGKGQSVWLGWFQAYIFLNFKSIAELVGDQSFADELELRANFLVETIESRCWDGEWYIRAFYDTGEPIGSASSDECKIDSLSQSWAVLTKLGNHERCKIALQSCLKHLVDEENRIIKLLTPPFDKTRLNPGYIKGYIPGIRENGAQYTHASVWLIMAFAEIGDIQTALELFNMINPVDIYLTREDAPLKYATEPYVLCGDVYSNPMVAGRGGWSWYTGSAGWCFQLIMKYFLGLEISNGKLYFKRCLPPIWDKVNLLYFNSEIEIINGISNEPKIFLDESEIENGIPFDHLKNRSRIKVDWS